MSEIKPTDRVCFNCAHGVFDDNAKQVICHYLPPTAILMQVPNPRHQFDPKQPPMALVNQALPPTVNPDWWCSKFKAKESKLVQS